MSPDALSVTLVTALSHFYLLHVSIDLTNMTLESDDVLLETLLTRLWQFLTYLTYLLAYITYPTYLTYLT